MENKIKLYHVYKPSVAHQLLQMGYVIKDIRPQPQKDGTIDYSRALFLFEEKEGISYAIKALTRKRVNKDQENFTVAERV